MSDKKLDERTISEIKKILKKAGVKDFNSPIGIRDSLRKKGECTLENQLRKIAKQNGFNQNVSELFLAAGLKSRKLKTTEGTFTSYLKEHYPLDDVVKAYETGANNNLTPISKFRAAHRQEYNNYAGKMKRNHLPSVRTLMNRLYPELAEMFPGMPPLYDFVSRKPMYHDIDFDALGIELKSIFFSGGDISKAALGEHNREIYRTICSIAQRPGFYKKGRTASQVIQNLSGIRLSEFKLEEFSKSNKLGELSELFTKMLLLLSSGMYSRRLRQTPKFREIFPRIDAVVDSRGAKVEKEEGEGYIFPDIIVMSESPAAVEVKHMKRHRSATAAKIKKDFGHKNLYFGSRKIRERVVFLHGHDNITSRMAEEICESPGIKIFTSRDFEDSLERALEQCKEDFPLNSRQIRDLYATVSYSPHLLLKESQSKKFDYSMWVMRTVCQMLLQHEKIKKHPLIVLGQKGREMHNEKGFFQYFKIPLSKFEHTETYKYVANNIEKYWEKNKLFADLETAGLRRDDLVISSGFARKENGELSIELAFARNPLEEAALLQYLKEKVEGHEILVTFNGRVFDIPVMKRRTEANLIQAPKIERDSDVYAQCFRREARRLGLKNSRLRQIDMLCGENRTDIPGRQVPIIYRNYVYDAEGIWDASPILEHNAHDMISLIAAYIFAKKELSVKF